MALEKAWQGNTALTKSFYEPFLCHPEHSEGSQRVDKGILHLVHTDTCGLHCCRACPSRERRDATRGARSAVFG
jgi:hypothetical protein